MNVHGEVGAREKVLLCALATLEESVGSVYGIQSPQVRLCDRDKFNLLLFGRHLIFSLVGARTGAQVSGPSEQ
jgi:hypothetical protein